MKVPTYLDDVCGRLQSEFESNRRVMSFDEYLALQMENPGSQVRDASQYLRDCFDYFGSADEGGILGPQRRWNLFDVPWDEGRHRLIGQEGVQQAIYRSLLNFARQGFTNKLLLLHGPNGSAKSSILSCIARALEHYSRTEEGAVYCFHWIFPQRSAHKGKLGFGGGPEGELEVPSYAHLPEDQVAAAIPGDLRDHPLLLLPQEERLRLMEAAVSEGRLPEVLVHGDLSPRNQQIAELLFNSYGGDFRKVLRHVQVRRFYFSRSFRRGVVTVEPQMHVDAAVRQLTGDRSLTSLPPILQSTTLYEPFGDLVDAHRGMIEYSDLLKRPLDTFKYLLATCEKSSVALSNQILKLDTVFFASSNEAHLTAFRDYPDWPSFQGRFELIRVPYLRSYQTEQAIYDAQIDDIAAQVEVAPHTTMVVSLWAVLTRLKKPNPERYPKKLRGTIAALTPLEKAELYAAGRTPSGLTLGKARLLRSHIRNMVDEEAEDGYEGMTGASPRAMKLVLLNAAQRAEFEVLSPPAVFAEIRDLCQMKSTYSFLRAEPNGAYGDHESFVGTVRERWLDVADEELTRSMGFVTRTQYDELFQKYLMHVSHAGRGERLLNPVTGNFEDPDLHFMEDMESRFSIEQDAASFRSLILGRIGASTQKGASSPVDYRELFPNLFSKLEGSYFNEQRSVVCAQAEDLLHHLSEPETRLSASAQKMAEATLEDLKTSYGYSDTSARETISILVSERYQT